MAKREAQIRLLEGAIQNRLARRLRAMPESRAVRTLQRLIAIEPQAGLLLVNRVLRSKPFLESILRDGLRDSNESTCRIWLDTLGRRLGIGAILEAVQSQEDPHRGISNKVLYWLPSLFKDDPALKDWVEILKRRSEPISAESLAERSFLVASRGWSSAA